MKIKKFIESVKEKLGLDDIGKDGKKKSVKKLLLKLKKQKETVEKALEKSMKKSEKEEIKEELSVIKYLIKKGEKALKKLNS